MTTQEYDSLEVWEEFLANVSAKLKEKRQEIEEYRNRIWKMLGKENARK